VKGLPTTLRCSSGKATKKVTLPRNAKAVARDYTFLLTANGRGSSVRIRTFTETDALLVNSPSLTVGKTYRIVTTALFARTYGEAPTFCEIVGSMADGVGALTLLKFPMPADDLVNVSLVVTPPLTERLDMSCWYACTSVMCANPGWGTGKWVVALWYVTRVKGSSG
jgi:hypothetical protein